MDLILRKAKVQAGDGERLVDIAIREGVIQAVGPHLAFEGDEVDLAGRLCVPGFVESHIHLDKACILDRCQMEEGTLDEAIREVSKAKRDFSLGDIQSRARQTIEKAILQGTTRMRTHLEVDPGIGLKGIEAVVPLIKDYAWALDLEICVFPQEGLLNNPGTEELMIAALERGASVIGGCPYTDSDPEGQIDRIFELARRFDVDIDFHLDFDLDPQAMTVGKVCQNAQDLGWGGRVTIGHVSKLSALPPSRLGEIARLMADSGVALTVLPSTDLYLMSGGRDHLVPRGVAPVDKIAREGVTCALSTNNVLNPFTPFGDASLVRMANLYANIGRIGTRKGQRTCLEMVTSQAAKLMRLSDYGIAAGNPADVVVLDCRTVEDAVRELATPLIGFKRGRRTFTRDPARLHPP